jgi:hypothetical protein
LLDCDDWTGLAVFRPVGRRLWAKLSWRSTRCQLAHDLETRKEHSLLDLAQIAAAHLRFIGKVVLPLKAPPDDRASDLGLSVGRTLVAP